MQLWSYYAMFGQKRKGYEVKEWTPFNGVKLRVEVTVFIVYGPPCEENDSFSLLTISNFWLF